MAGKLIKGMLIGAIAGSVIGVLYAPRKGSKTRKRLRRKGADLRSEIGNLEKKMSNEYRSIKEDTEELLEQSKERLQNAP